MDLLVPYFFEAITRLLPVILLLGVLFFLYYKIGKIDNSRTLVFISFGIILDIIAIVMLLFVL